MALIYQTSESHMNKMFVFDPRKCDPVAQYMKHYENRLILEFISKNGSFSEKRDAEKEIEISKRKMNYWSRYVTAAKRDQELIEAMNVTKKHWK